MTILENLQHWVQSTDVPTVKGLVVLGPDGSKIGGAGGGGSDVQYTDGGVPPLHPVGTMPIYNNSGSWQAIDLTHGLPVSVVSGAAGGGVAQLQVRNAGDSAWVNVVTGGSVTLPVDVRTSLPAGSNVIGGITSTDGALASIGSTGDSASLSTVIGRLKTLVNLYPTAAALADTVSNPTLTQINTYPMGYNGSTWDRLHATSGSLNVHIDSQTVTVTGPLTDTQLRASAVPVTANAGSGTFNIQANATVNLAQINSVTPLVGAGNTGTGSLRVTVATDQATLPVAQSPSTTLGWSRDTRTALTNTAVAAKGSGGSVGGWVIHNPAAATTYIQIFNVAAGSVTLGTTAPDMVVPLAAGATANVEYTAGIPFSTAISWAATTTATGSTAPATAAVGTLLYK